ncbi:putative Nitrogen assimilation regulatory protein nac [Hyphomicrobiales bacterium]|nr:putative Nitrogen assimilation regulatory protein nac [Hyphomicrobiales bacterium]CAH1697551.1 LysR family transcriptional regulator [Hyphomicrobiales bacterium]CAI0346306.1 putative Nitrogen assimilation regulatory protein nac [Hyphomicrobiales bacterium]
MAIQLRHLNYFVHIVDAGSFSRAATVANIAQPALSQQIAGLELELGVKLLTRSARGVTPTDAGLVLYRQACSIRRQIDQIPALVRATEQEPTGSVSLGMPQTLAARVGSAFVAACRQKFPRLLLRLMEGASVQLRDNLTASRVDISLIHEQTDIPGLAYRPIFHQALFALARRDREGPDGDTIDLEDLMRRPLVLPTAPNAVRDKVDAALAERKLRPTIVAELNSFHGILDVVRDDAVYTILPWPATEETLGGSDFRAWMIEPRLEITTSFAVSTLTPVSGAAFIVQEFFVEFLAEKVRAEKWIGARLDESYRAAL